MLEIISKKSKSGDLYINLARQYLDSHEWGLAKKAVEQGFIRGRLSEPGRAHALKEEIHQCMGIQSKQTSRSLSQTTR